MNHSDVNSKETKYSIASFNLKKGRCDLFFLRNKGEINYLAESKKIIANQLRKERLYLFGM